MAHKAKIKELIHKLKEKLIDLLQTRDAVFFILGMIAAYALQNWLG